MDSTYTDATEDNGLTLAELQQAINEFEAMLSPVYYHISMTIPLMDDEGKLVFFAVTFGDTKVWFCHPDNFPVMEKAIRHLGHKPVEFNMEKYQREELDRLMREPLKPTVFYTGYNRWTW